MVRSYGVPILRVNTVINWETKFATGTWHLRGIDTPGRFYAMFYKGDNFCVFLFAFQHTKCFLEGGLL